MSDRKPILLSANQIWAMLIGIQLVTLPFYWRMPIPVIVSILIFTVWVCLIALGRSKPPGTYIRLIVLATTLAVMTISYGTLLGREAGTGFLAMLAYLKLFEINNRRDQYIVIYLNYFLIASNFFHTQSPWVAVYVFAVVMYLTSLLILFNDRLLSLVWPQRLKLAFIVLLQAIPLMLILFVLFPRIPGPLWGLPKDAATAVTGLSDDMSPGSISTLIRSDEVSFRVRFKGEVPKHQTMYWRGPVFSRYDGRTWTSGNRTTKSPPNLIEPVNEVSQIEYTVTMEPHQRDWMFALEYPVQLEGSGYHLTREMQLLNRSNITNIFQYTLISDEQVQNHSLFKQERLRNLQLPDRLNPQTTALAKRWQQESNGDKTVVLDRALRHFQDQPFVYTVNPPILGNDAMNDFLFETQRGFCEHYSSAFVYLMRAAGIPARVVTGYQGGDKNPLDDYIIVRQSNAHAWAEVWLDDSGWVRVDPTAAVSPYRIELGIQDAVVERELLPAILISNNAWLNNARYQWDSFNNMWNEWVVGFDQNRQKKLFQHLGIERVGWQDLIIWMMVGLALVGGVVAWWVFKQGSGNRTDRIRHAYDKFCAKLAKTGIQRLTYEGPQEYYGRIKDKLIPSCASQANDVTQQYLQIRYGGNNSRQYVKNFLQAVSRFRARV